MKHSRAFVLSLVAFSFVVGLSCSSTTEPVAESPREYKWTAMTLPLPANSGYLIRSISGTRANDVYLSGYTSSNGFGLFHYDGDSWKTLTPMPVTEIKQVKVLGYRNLIVAGGISLADNSRRAVLKHIQGSTTVDVIPANLSYEVGQIASLWASSVDDIWCGTEGGYLLQYDGMTWRADSMGPKIIFPAVGGDESLKFAFGYSIDSPVADSTFWYKNSGSGWVQQSPTQSWFTSSPAFGLNSVVSPAPGVYYSSNRSRVFSYLDGSWDPILDMQDTDFSRLYAVKSSNLYVVGSNYLTGKLVYHWNGVDWQPLTALQEAVGFDSAPKCIYATDSEAFIVLQNENANEVVVMHGK